MNKASECFLLGKVDDAIFHWMENIKRDPGRSTNSSVLVIASLLSCYRLRESLLFLNWCYLHNDTSLPAVTQVLAQVLYQFFTGKFSITWSIINGDLLLLDKVSYYSQMPKDKVSGCVYWVIRPGQKQLGSHFMFNVHTFQSIWLLPILIQ